MKHREAEVHSLEHAQAYHAASRCQAASLSLTPRRLHGWEKACLVEGKKTGGSFAHGNGCQTFQEQRLYLGCTCCVKTLGSFKGRRC